MSNNFLVKGILLEDIIETGGNAKNFNTYYQNNSNETNTTTTNYNSMKPLTLGYQIGGSDFSNQCTANKQKILATDTTNDLDKRIEISIPTGFDTINSSNVRAKHFRAILVGSAGGGGGGGGGANIHIKSTNFNGTVGGSNGSIGGYGYFSYCGENTPVSLTNNELLYINIGSVGADGSNGNKGNCKTMAASSHKCQGNDGKAGTDGGNTLLEIYDNSNSIYNNVSEASGGNGGTQGNGSSIKYVGSNSNYNRDYGNDGVDGNTDRGSENNSFDNNTINDLGVPNGNSGYPYGGAQIIWLWD